MAKKLKTKTNTMPNAGIQGQGLDHLYIPERNVKFCSCSGKQLGNFFKN
jgi:hypothetical protein